MYNNSGRIRPYRICNRKRRRNDKLFSTYEFVQTRFHAQGQQYYRLSLLFPFLEGQVDGKRINCLVSFHPFFISDDSFVLHARTVDLDKTSQTSPCDFFNLASNYWNNLMML